MDPVDKNNAGPNPGTSEVVTTEPGAPAIEGGFPVNQTVPAVDTPPTDAAGAPEPAVDGQTPAIVPELTPEEVAAAGERLKQESSRNSKLLNALGVDPLSDIAEQLESGLITEEMVRTHVANRLTPPAASPIQPTVQQVTTDPVALAQQSLLDAQALYDKEEGSGEGISLQTNRALLEAIQGVNDARNNAIEDRINRTDEKSQGDQNIEAVLSVARQGNAYGEMDEILRSSTDAVTIGLTGIIADREAKGLGIDPKTLSSGQYAYFANKASAQLGTLANFYFQRGHAAAQKGIALNNINNGPNPAPVGGSPPAGVPRNPATPLKIGLNNLHEVARNYATGSGQQV